MAILASVQLVKKKKRQKLAYPLHNVNHLPIHTLRILRKWRLCDNAGAWSGLCPIWQEFSQCAIDTCVNLLDNLWCDVLDKVFVCCRFPKMDTQIVCKVIAVFQVQLSQAILVPKWPKEGIIIQLPNLVGEFRGQKTRKQDAMMIPVLLIKMLVGFIPSL